MFQNMKNLLTVYKSEIFSVNLIVILILTRLLPHPPNFTPIIAVAIMSGYFFRNIYLSLGFIFLIGCFITMRPFIKSTVNEVKFTYVAQEYKSSKIKKMKKLLQKK